MDVAAQLALEPAVNSHYKAMMSDAIPGSSELCMRCGMCCDGTIYDTVAIHVEDHALLKAAGLPLSPEGDRYEMPQPCRALSDKLCTIYKGRPGTCRRYACEVLRRLEAGEISAVRAGELVDTALAAAAAVAEHALPHEDRVAQRHRWQRQCDDWQGDPVFHLRMMALNQLIDKEFRRPDEPLLERRQA